MPDPADTTIGAPISHLRSELLEIRGGIHQFFHPGKDAASRSIAGRSLVRQTCGYWRATLGPTPPPRLDIAWMRVARDFFAVSNFSPLDPPPRPGCLRRPIHKSDAPFSQRAY